MNNLIQSMVALYGAFIRLYPREFKLEFAGEMRSVFMALAQDAASAGMPALAAFCLRELRDFPINLLRTHLEKNPMSRIFDSQFVRFTLRGVLAFVALFTTYYLAFFMMINQMTTNATIFFTSDYFTYDAHHFQALVLLFVWGVASALCGTVFAVIFGERTRVRWLAALGILASLPWTIPYTIFGLNSKLSPAIFGLNSLLNPNQLEMSKMANLEPNSAWIKIAALLVLVSICGILAVLLFEEQPRFRQFVLAGMIVWLPGTLSSDVFHLGPFIMTDAQIATQIVLTNLVLGALLAGMFGLLLKDRRKMFWLIVAGTLLYPLVESVFYQQIYATYISLLAPLFPTGDLTTLMNLTIEQLALLDAITSAVIGLLFGLPLALIFTWLENSRFPALPWRKQQEPA